MKIGELATRAGCTVETVRYYEREGLLPEPGRGANNYRHYGRAHLETLCFIRNCRVLEMSLEEIRTLLGLRHDHDKDCGEVTCLLEEHITHVTERIARLEELKGQLESLRGLCSGVRPRGSCEILLELAGRCEPGEPGRDGAGTHVHGARCSGPGNACP